MDGICWEGEMYIVGIISASEAGGADTHGELVSSELLVIASEIILVFLALCYCWTLSVDLSSIAVGACKGLLD